MKPIVFLLLQTDTEDPKLSGCLSEVIANVSVGDSTADVVWDEPVASDNSGSVTLTATRRPGATYTIGNHENVYFAVDAAGNFARCTITIIVQGKVVINNYKKACDFFPLFCFLFFVFLIVLQLQIMTQGKLHFR